MCDYGNDDSRRCRYLKMFCYYASLGFWVSRQLNRCALRSNLPPAQMMPPIVQTKMVVCLKTIAEWV